jgi:hypothetical protein
MLFVEQVVGDAKDGARKHLFVITKIRKCARFSHQRIDDVAVVDCGGVLANQSGHILDQRIAVVNDDSIHLDSHVDAVPD